jgi:hypothetical protein
VRPIYNYLRKQTHLQTREERERKRSERKMNERKSDTVEGEVKGKKFIVFWIYQL